MVLKEDGHVGACNKRIRVGEHGNGQSWSELPPDLLVLILKHLGLKEFFIFTLVCKSWRSAAAVSKNSFMAKQPPLLFLMPTNAKKFCYLYSIFDGHVYKRAFSNLSGKRCIGFSCGYLFFHVKEDTMHGSPDTQIWLWNPFTGHELCFPNPPESYSRLILTSYAMPDRLQCVVAIVYSRLSPFVQFCRYGDDKWTVIHIWHHCWWIDDIAVFKGTVYLLNSNAQVGILDLVSEPHARMLEVEVDIGTESRSLFNLELVASDQQLYMVKTQGLTVESKKFDVFRLEFSSMQWRRLKSLSNEALFLSNDSSGVITPEIVGSDKKGKNCIYYLDNRRCEYYLHSMDMEGNSSVKAFTCKPHLRIASSVWCFPNLCV